MNHQWFYSVFVKKKWIYGVLGKIKINFEFMSHNIVV